MTTILNAPSMADVVASNIRAEAGRCGFSQIELSRRLSMSQSAVHHRWAGSRPWQLDELDDVARALGIDVAILFDRDRLPRLDSNQQPAGYSLSLVSEWVLDDESRQGPATDWTLTA